MTSDHEAALARDARRLRELDHRAKNTLQLISSLIQLQERRLADPAAKTAVASVLGRVNAIASAHRSLREIDGEAALDVAAFLRDFAADMLEASGREDVSLEVDAGPLVVAASRAAPIALIAHELLDNAFRHAFPGRAGSIRLSVSSADGSHLIEVRDDGEGRDERMADGFGLGLVDILTRQISARLVHPRVASGHAVAIELPPPAD